jgi:hypothetical protein
VSTAITGTGSGVVTIGAGKARAQGLVWVAVSNSSGMAVEQGVPRADFLAAVASELDAIVIERAELPKVEPVGARGRLSVEGGSLVLVDGDTTESTREIALRWLAGAEYLREHPPVDEAQVRAITTALRAEGNFPEGVDLRPMAESLYRAGVRVEVTP